MRVSGKDPSVTSRDALLSTRPGKQIARQGLFKSKGYRMFARYRDEYEARFPAFADSLASELHGMIAGDPDPAGTQRRFAEEVGEESMALDPGTIGPVRDRLSDPAAVRDRVGRILDSNFVKMTFPVFSALYDAAEAGRRGGGEEGGGGEEEERAALKRDVVEGHVIAIDLSEPMDRIADRDEDLEYLDDYRLMNPHILAAARRRIGRGGGAVLESFEDGFRSAREGQAIDVALKSDPLSATAELVERSYAKYRAVMGTAGRNMALAERPLGEVFALGMARAAECAGCGNEIEDALKGGRVKVPSWPMYYSLLAGGDVRRGFEATMEKGRLYLREARTALGMLPDGFTHREFLEFLFLTLDHYNEFWYARLSRAGMWERLEATLPRRARGGGGPGQ